MKRILMPLQGLSPGTRVLLAGGLLYTLVYCVFWPKYYTSMDESVYLISAYAIRHGTFYVDVAGVQSLMVYGAGSHWISQYPPGMPLLLAAFSLAGWKFALGANLFVHLATYWVVARILRRLGVPGPFALLYLLHPIEVLYSRSLYSDMATGLAVTLAVDCALRRRPAWSGAWLGISVIFRTANLISIGLMAAAYFALVLTIERENKDRSTAKLGLESLGVLLGAAPPLALAYAYQAIIQHGGWRHYGGPPPSLAYLPTVLPKYVMSLALIYPGMVLAPLLYRGKGKWPILALSYGFLLLYGAYYFTNIGKNFAEEIIAGPRYILVVLPLFITAYCQVVWRMSRTADRRVLTMAGAAGAVVLFAVCTALQWRHQKYLREMDNARVAVLSHVNPDDTLLCNGHVAKLFQPAWGTRRFTLLGQAWTYSVNVRAAEAEIRNGLAKPGVSVYLADWSREYRPETSDEVRLISDLRKEFPSREIVPGNGAELPQGMHLYQFLSTPR